MEREPRYSDKEHREVEHIYARVNKRRAQQSEGEDE
jgi:hypothetical protein